MIFSFLKKKFKQLTDYIGKVFYEGYRIIIVC